ncbi:cbb3-type cytochrome oxidase subunit 3 [Paenibacillus qinlingensis]|uniref:Cbb3-type cytochrome oxidase subunit 3 n=1 Tax=Paenibacillus qinlingensis TaxID=1837343 RepID=A0ABU1NQW0_9BACL|nr:cbb3-type cytochrome oxidase subunit 3 [Paenibacillus qinlingensis]
MNIFHLSYIVLFSALLAVGTIGVAWFVFHKRKRKAR